MNTLVVQNNSLPLPVAKVIAGAQCEGYMYLIYEKQSIITVITLREHSMINITLPKTAAMNEYPNTVACHPDIPTVVYITYGKNFFNWGSDLCFRFQNIFSKCSTWA
jgi:hypothetical protein